MDAAAACKAINSWVEKETKDMIKKLFDPADLDPNTMVALCSALHFKGTWKFPFDAPFEDTFKLNDKESTKATLMTVKVWRFHAWAVGIDRHFRIISHSPTIQTWTANWSNCRIPMDPK